MTIIEHDLLRNQKPRKKGLKVKVDLYAYATDLYKELEGLRIIQRMRDIPQLGVIRVPKNLEKTRFDYTILQLYFHQLIKKELQPHLELTYNNVIKSQEFRQELRYLSSEERPSIGDMLQLLTIAYNVGHFYNTFVASRAVIMLSEKDPSFRIMMIQSLTDPRYQTAAEKIFSESNYQRFHLLNSLLILECCDQNKQAVILAQELIYAYLNESELSENSKLHHVFSLFRSVRNVSYISYDLQIANTSFTIDLGNEKSILVLFRELLSAYNDRRSTNQLVVSISKMLDDTVYNENSNAICYYKISQKIVSALSKTHEWTAMDYYNNFWFSAESVLNIRYPQNRDYSPEGILKLTFALNDKDLSKKLLMALERISNLRVGYYDRYNGERTLLVSIRKSCLNKTVVALRTLKTIISHLRNVLNIENSDSRYLLTSKFFIHYLCMENPIVIKPTIDYAICVLCSRGKHKRIQDVQALLNNDKGTQDEYHEASFLCWILKQDTVSDTAITIPGSILVYEKDRLGRKLCEFDGMVIYPMRKQSQVIFMEAKNTSNAPSFGKKCLCEKLDKLKLAYNKSEVKIQGRDAFLKITIK